MMQIDWTLSLDQLPEPDVVVLVAGGCAVWTGERWETCMEGYPRREIEWYVEHWAPLPQPPSLKSGPEAIAAALEILRRAIHAHEPPLKVSIWGDRIYCTELNDFGYYSAKAQTQLDVLKLLTENLCK